MNRKHREAWEMSKNGLVEITEMVICMNDAAWNLVDDEVAGAFKELFLHRRVERTTWPEGRHVLRGVNLFREKGDEVWRAVDDFIDFTCDDSGGAFIEFVEIHGDGSVKTYSNRTSSKFRPVLSVVGAVAADGSFVSDLFTHGGDEE
jgi:hypothetical protein